MTQALSTLWVWLLFLVGVATHTYWQANKSASNDYTPWKSVAQYLNRYSGIIVVRLVAGIVIYGIWWSNPDAVSNLCSAMSAKAQGAGWDKAAIVFSVIKISARNVFVSLGFGISIDAVLFFGAKYIPGFKTVVPDLPASVTLVDAGAVAAAQKKAAGGQ